MQTKGQQQFKIRWQVVVIILLCLVALALPLGGVIVMLQSLAQSRAPQETETGVSEALQSRLEGIVDARLAGEHFPANEPRIELIADDLSRERARIDGLLAAHGGTAIPRSESETEIRLLIQVAPERLEGFLREYRGMAAGPAGDISAGFLEVVIKKGRPP